MPTYKEIRAYNKRRKDKKRLKTFLNGLEAERGHTFFMAIRREWNSKMRIPTAVKRFVYNETREVIR